MTCVHLQQLYQLCQDQKLRLSSSDLIHIVCDQCQREEVCPSVLVSEVAEQGTAPDAATEERGSSGGKAC
jgi:hypothetical protein